MEGEESQEGSATESIQPDEIETDGKVEVCSVCEIVKQDLCKTIFLDALFHMIIRKVFFG